LNKKGSKRREGRKEEQEEEKILPSLPISLLQLKG
jgi:hypothetical protein